MSEQPEFSDEVLEKAKTLTDVKQDDHFESIWWINDDQYRVQVVEYLGDRIGICSCPNGQRNIPAKCYHAAAVLERAALPKAGPFTAHGHNIDGVTKAGVGWPDQIKRCGGPGMCGPCSQEASYHQNNQERQTP